MIKRSRQWIKAYFIFSANERKGILSLLIILCVVIILPSVYAMLFPQQPLQINITDLPLDTASPLQGEEATAGNQLFSFDPNTASANDLLMLGLRVKNIKTIHNYISKGGHFNRPEDLRKLYGIDSALISKLIPYVVIESDQRQAKMFLDSTRKVKQQKPLELNDADSQSLVALYRIGPGLAHRILEYRNRLGGFISIEQLKEIWGFDEDILYDLNGKIYVDASKARIFPVNSVTREELQTHPYFKYKLSNAVINYRNQHGNYQSLLDLKKIILVNDSVYQRITLYLKID